MTKIIKHDYDNHLLVYMARLAYDNHICRSLFRDEYTFSTYFSILLQGLKNEETLSEILEKTIPNFSYSDTNVNLEDDQRLMKLVSQLRSQFNEEITTTYVKHFFISTAVFRSIFRNSDKDINKACEILKKAVNGLFDAAIQEQSGISSTVLNIGRLMQVLNLSMAEARLLEISLLFSTDVRSQIFRDFHTKLVKDSNLSEYMYLCMLGTDLSEKERIDAISENSKPIILGMVFYNTREKILGNMTNYWCYTISSYVESDEEFLAKFINKIVEKKKSFAGAIAKIVPKDESLLIDFIKKATEKDINSFNAAYLAQTDEEKIEKINESKGLNALLYGPPKLDKIGYVHNLLNQISKQGYQVNLTNSNSSDIPSICYIAQQIVAGSFPGSVLVVEKADQALTKFRQRPSWLYFMDEDNEKKEILDSDDLLLSQNNVTTIWLADSAIEIEPETVGRFLFHAELKGGSRKDRRLEIEKIVSELGFPPEVHQELAKYTELNIEQISSAAQLVTMLDMRKNQDECSKVLLHLVENSQKALDRTKQEQIRSSVTKYDLSLLNIAGNFTIEKIIESLKLRGKGGICFYGAPGTGKTQLAEHIAMQLDKPLLIKPASELLSKWLGESEKNIAAAFQQAKDEDAILLLDEADSLMRDRANAKQSWEVTQVNELLMRMERFTENGIFICATNMMKNIDAAALRRFTFKLEFRPLTLEQRIRMLKNECPEIAEMTPEQLQGLEIEVGLIKYLTPGDYAVVKRQADLLDEKLTARDWLTRLENEAKAKLVGIEQNGFGEPVGGLVTMK